MNRLTCPSGASTEQGLTGVQRDLAAAVLQWEGALDTDFFRAQIWSYREELPQGEVARHLKPVFVRRDLLPDRAS